MLPWKSMVCGIDRDSFGLCAYVHGNNGADVNVACLLHGPFSIARVLAWSGLMQQKYTKKSRNVSVGQLAYTFLVILFQKFLHHLHTILISRYDIFICKIPLLSTYLSLFKVVSYRLGFLLSLFFCIWNSPRGIISPYSRQETFQVYISQQQVNRETFCSSRHLLVGRDWGEFEEGLSVLLVLVHFIVVLILWSSSWQMWSQVLQSRTKFGQIPVVCQGKDELHRRVAHQAGNFHKDVHENEVDLPSSYEILDFLFLSIFASTQYFKRWWWKNVSLSKRASNYKASSSYVFQWIQGNFLYSLHIGQIA